MTPDSIIKLLGSVGREAGGGEEEGARGGGPQDDT